MGRFGLFLIDPNQLFREGLRRLLNGEKFRVLGEARSLIEACTTLTVEQRPDLIVLDIESADEEAAPALLGTLRDRLPEAKIVVLSAGCSRGALARAVGWSVDAYLLKDMSPETLTQSLQLVMLGQQIFPPGHMGPLLQTEPKLPRAPEPRESPAKGLSPRETQILRHLANGCSNKAIARELNISEATVKVHLNALLRKVRASNRTQAAMWALNNGMTSDPEG
jgi:two-component system, NarL family, nitrate/nitrite response regulator NarL